MYAVLFDMSDEYLSFTYDCTYLFEYLWSQLPLKRKKYMRRNNE